MLVVALVPAYFIVRSSLSNRVPKEFQDARLQGALIAQNIVDLSAQLSEQMTVVNNLDKEQNYTEALNVVTAVMQKNQEIRNQAVALSGEVEKMIKNLSEVKSFEARQAALEAISNRLALLSRLINYSGYLAQLLGALRDKFTHTGSPQNVGYLVNQINAEVTAINSFNKQSIQAMERFDAQMGQ